MDAPLQIAFRHTAPSEALETLIRARAEKLGRYHPHIIAGRVVVEIPYRSAASARPPVAIAVEIDVPGRTLVARDEGNVHQSKSDQTAIVNRVFAAIERRLAADAALKRGAVKTSEAAGETGRVSRLFPAQSYGFIEIKEGPDLYFTRNAVQSGSFDTLAEGSLVEITRATTEGPMGPQASSVRPFGAAAA